MTAGTLYGYTSTDAALFITALAPLVALMFGVIVAVGAVRLLIGWLGLGTGGEEEMADGPFAPHASDHVQGYPRKPAATPDGYKPWATPKTQWSGNSFQRAAQKWGAFTSGDMDSAPAAVLALKADGKIPGTASSYDYGTWDEPDVRPVGQPGQMALPATTTKTPLGGEHVQEWGGET